MKLKLSCLLSVCLLMGSCSGGTSSRVADSGTSTSPSSPVSSSINPGYTSSNQNTSTPTNTNEYSADKDPSLAPYLKILDCGNTYSISTCYTNPN